MNRQEHLEWAKQRAIEYIDRDDIPGSYASFVSDMNKHGELKDHLALAIGTMLLFSGNLQTKEEMKSFIEGFN